MRLSRGFHAGVVRGDEAPVDEAGGAAPGWRAGDTMTSWSALATIVPRSTGRCRRRRCGAAPTPGETRTILARVPSAPGCHPRGRHVADRRRCGRTRARIATRTTPPGVGRWLSDPRSTPQPPWRPLVAGRSCASRALIVADPNVGLVVVPLHVSMERASGPTTAGSGDCTDRLHRVVNSGIVLALFDVLTTYDAGHHEPEHRGGHDHAVVAYV